jgi:putative peptidoglycan lipid II flippase
MNKFLSATNRLLFNKQKNIISSALILSLMIILSRLFGFIRYRVFVNFFSKEELDIFFASFRIPDLIFEILITGALTSSFIPVYVKYQKDKMNLSVNISSIINLIFVVMTCLILVLVLITDWIIPIITPGFSQNKINQIILYTKVLLIGQLPFLILGNILIAIGQANKLFLITAIAPIVYNLMIILFTVFFAKNLHLDAIILGVVFGALFFFLSQLVILFRTDFIYQFILKKTSGLVEFIKISIPRILSVIIAQIDATIDLSLATILGVGNYTIFYFSQHLQLLPVSIIGMAFGQASLPYLSELYREGKIDDFKKLIIQSFLNVFYLTVPIAFFFIFARTPLVRIFFGGQKFDWSATVLAAITLSYFSLSIPFHSLYYLVVRVFYSILDTRTPFFIGLASVLLNTLISLVFVLIFHLPVWSLSLAFSFSITLNCILLILILQKRFKSFLQFYFFKELGKIILITFTSSVVAYFLLKITDRLIVDTTRTVNLFLLLGGIFVLFYILYIVQSLIFSVSEVFLLTRLLQKIKEFPKKIFEVYSQYE